MLYSFTAEVIKSVEYQECEIKALIQDYKDYIAYIADLQAQGEFRAEMIISSVPAELQTAKRVFCSRGCSATHYSNGQCFLWNSPQRINFQRLYRSSLKEQEDKSFCKDYEIIKNTVAQEYDWKKTEKAKNYKNTEWKQAGEGVLWENL